MNVSIYNIIPKYSQNLSFLTINIYQRNSVPQLLNTAPVNIDESLT